MKYVTNASTVELAPRHIIINMVLSNHHQQNLLTTEYDFIFLRMPRYTEGNDASPVTNVPCAWSVASSLSNALWKMLSTQKSCEVPPYRGKASVIDGICLLTIYQSPSSVILISMVNAISSRLVV